MLTSASPWIEPIAQRIQLRSRDSVKVTLASSSRVRSAACTCATTRRLIWMTLRVRPV